MAFAYPIQLPSRPKLSPSSSQSTCAVWRNKKCTPSAALKSPVSIDQTLLQKVHTIALAAFLTFVPAYLTIKPFPALAEKSSIDPTTFKVPGGAASTQQTGAKKTLTRGVSLIGADFAQGDFEGVSFQQSILRQANFEGANLANASFFDADLAGVNFKGSNLAGANLELANMRKADVTDAVLAGKLHRFKTSFGFSTSQHLCASALYCTLADNKSFIDVFHHLSLISGAYISSTTKLEGITIAGSDWSECLLRKDQQKYLCSLAEGTNPKTGVDTKESLMCPL